jgi:hypothetical protein
MSSKTQATSRSPGKNGLNTTPALVHDVLRSPGRPLSPQARDFFEPRLARTFGGGPVNASTRQPQSALRVREASDRYEKQATEVALGTRTRESHHPVSAQRLDLSQVRIHNDERAAESARAMGARAFTVGHQIVFGSGQYSPRSGAGLALLGHELAHVAQQSRGMLPGPSIQRLGIFETIGVFLGLVEGNFSDDELKDYLNKVTTTQKIEDKFDSDNKARAIVRKWKAGDAKFQLTGAQKLLLIREMDTGYVGKADQNGILDLLERADNGDLRIIFGGGGMNPQALSNDFSGAEKKRLESFYGARFRGGKAALLGGNVDPAGASPQVAPTFPYNRNIFQAKLAGPYTVDEILNDVKALSSTDRDEALKDFGKERTRLNRLAADTIDKYNAENDPVKKTALEHQIRDLRLSQRKIDLILQPTFKDIAVAEDAPTLEAGTHLPSVAEKTQIGEALKPDLKTSVGGAVLPFQEKLPGETKNYEEKLREMTPGMITRYFNEMVVGRGTAEHADPAKVHPLSEFERIGNRSKKETDAVFGSYKSGPPLKADKPAQGGRPAQRGNIHDLFADTQKQLSRMSAAQKKQMAKNLMSYFFQTDTDVQALNRAHNADPKFTPPNPEATMENNVADDTVSHPNEVKRLNEIDRGWDASAGGGEINLQIFKKDTPDKDRDFLWDMFQTVIHEYLHTLAHPNYNAFAASFGEASNQFNTLVEGVDSLLDEVVWANVAPRVDDPALRADVEGPTYSALPPIVVKPASRRRYPSYTQAIKLVNVVGIRNLYAAYFLGDVDKIKT